MSETEHGPSVGLDDEAGTRTGTPAVLAIDPGTTESAWLLYDPDHADVIDFAKEDNPSVLRRLERLGADAVVVIEKVESYGMAVGRDIFETVRWAGRFEERAQPRTVQRLPRRDVKLNLCGQARAKDPNVRQALLDRWGGKETAVGNKSAPGPLYGVSGDVWAALGVAVTWADTAHTSGTCPACAGMGCTDCCGGGR